jgi:hypothetical protein
MDKKGMNKNIYAVTYCFLRIYIAICTQFQIKGSTGDRELGSEKGVAKH